MVYGKVLGEVVNVRKLQQDEGRNRTTSLCESSVIHFWRERSSPEDRPEDYTMLYLENGRPNQVKEVRPGNFSVLGENKAHLGRRDGGKPLFIECSSQKGQRDFEKLCDFFGQRHGT